MGFVERAFTPPGAGGAPLGSPANPIPGAMVPPPTPQAAPAVPAAPATPAPPSGLTPASTPASRQRALTGAVPSVLGAAAAAGQTARAQLSKVLG
jgi:hypothetical protein